VTPFDVHVELLCDCSPYFDHLFRDRAVKSITDQPIRFQDESPDVFAELISWMYLGEVSVDLPSQPHILLFQLWVLAGKFEISELQNSVISLFKEIITDEPGTILGNDTIDYVYAHTQPMSPPRLLVVDIWVRIATRLRFLAHRERFPRPFLEDFSCALIERMEITQATKWESVDFQKRYFVQPIPSKNEVSNNPEIPQRATPTQMGQRKIKPLPRYSSTSSTSVASPASTAASVDPRVEIAHDMGQLQI
jgi:hypothetical protein